MDELENIIKYTKKLNLLYIEDNIQARENSLIIFEEFFENIIVAVDGKDGLDKFKSAQNVDIIITDINMPHINGLDMLEEIRAIDKHVPVLILSAYNESNFFIDSIKLDVEGYLLKPIDIEQFLFTLRKIVEKIVLKDEVNKNLNFLHQYQEATDAIAIVSKTDINGTITYVNDEFCKISEYNKDDLIGKNNNIVRSSDQPKEYYKEFWETIKNKKKIWQGVFRNISKSGKSYYVKSTIKPILDNDKKIVEFIALMDDITDIMNPRKQFYDLVDSIEDSIVVLIQIEDFDDIGRYYGQSLTTKIEEKFSSVLKKCLPESFKQNRLFALGNGEYALVKDVQDYTKSSKECIQELKEFQSNIDDAVMSIDDMEYDLSIMISYSYGKDSLENAKYGLKELEVSHHNFIVATDFYKKIHEEAEHNIKILKMIKNALSTDNVVSYFQPIINNKTKKIEKYESLVRIVDAEGNVISPFVFLDIAKKGKYYTQITHRVLENSFNALKHTKEDISINISALDIGKKYTRNKILQLLEKYKDDSHRIIFELLEDEGIKNLNVFKAFIYDVKKFGVKIAIDDFGTGYSNFERLVDYEPDILKIDGSLIKNIVNDKYSLNIVETIVTFSNKQNIQLVAEYVENEEIYDTLKDLGIDYSQGYYFGKPSLLN